MLWLPAIWLCLFSMLVGCGLLLVTGLQRLGGPSFRAPLSTFQVFWFGYALAVGFVQLYSLVLPVRAPTVVALWVMALAGFYVARGPVLARLRSLRARPRTVGAFALATLVIVSIVASRAAAAVTWYDTHLYHLQVVKWTRTFPAVPGLANLHYRLAYNSSAHLFAALTDVLWKGKASHIAFSLLVSVLIVQLSWHALQLGNARSRVGAAFSLLLLPFLLGRIWTDEIPSLSSDLALSVVCIATLLELMRLPARRARRDLALTLALSLAGVAATTKLGGVGMLAVVAGVGLYDLSTRAWSTRRFASLGVVPLLLLLGYLARQVVLSGWLLFPVPLGNLHLAWSFPEAEAMEQFRWIKSWARIPMLEPAEVLDHGFMRWFEPWFARFQESREMLLLAATAVMAWARLSAPRRLREPARGKIAIVAAFVSLVVWFRGAPDLRFGAAFFWLLLASVSAPLLGAALKERAGLPLALSLSLVLTSWAGGFKLQLPELARTTTLPEILPPGSIQALELSPGLKVFAPRDLSRDDRCSNHALPCTPFPGRQRLRQPGKLGAGFLH